MWPRLITTQWIGIYPKVPLSYLATRGQLLCRKNATAAHSARPRVSQICNIRNSRVRPAEIRSSLIAEKAQLSRELQTVKEQNKTLNEIAVTLQSTKQVVEELERVKAEKVSLQQEVVQQREKLKEALESSKDQLFDKTPSRKRKSWNENGKRSATFKLYRRRQ